LAVVALLSTTGQAADHAAKAALGGNPMADITDVYAWMAGSNLNLVMDVSPLDDGTHSFDPSVQYVFHLTSKAKLGAATPGDAETKVICRFASNLSVDCWVTDASGTTTKDYVSGDPSNTAGITSIDRKLKVFAGRRSDPAFFNLTGFTSAATELGKDLGAVDAAGCPTLADAEASRIQNILTTGSDTFAAANVMAIVVQIDTSLVTVAPNKTVAVWASTHAGS
jgi:hypothetical protein